MTLGNFNNRPEFRMTDHPKAAFAPNDHVARSAAWLRFAQTLYLGVFGGVVGALLGSFWGFGFFGFVTGFMLGLAARTAWVLFGQPAPADEYSGGKSRTEEEVRQALSDIQSNRK